MKKVLLEIDTTTDGVKDFNGNAIQNIEVVVGDTILFAAHFQETLALGVTSDLNLQEGGAPTALRCKVCDTNTTAAIELTFQSTFNNNDFPDNEDLTEGKVTWLVSFASAAITTLIGTATSATAILEFAWADNAGIPQTLAQIPMTLTQQCDDGAPGTPPPTSPTFSTAVEIAAAFVNRVTGNFAAATSKTLATDALAVTNSYHVVKAETGTADDLSTITGLTDQNFLALFATAGETITIKDAIGNIDVSGGADVILNEDGFALLTFNSITSKWKALGVPTHVHVAADVSDFDTEVGNHTAVTANTAHAALVTGNPHVVLATQITDFAAEVTANASVAANTTHRGQTTNADHQVTLEQARTVSDQVAGQIDMNTANKIVNLADGTSAGDAVNKGQLDAVSGGVSAYKDPVCTSQLIGNLGELALEALSPADADSYVVTALDGDSILNPGSLAIAIGDMVQFNNSVWVLLIGQSGGFPPVDTRVFLATQTPLISPYVDATDDGKLYKFGGASLTATDTSEAVDGNAASVKCDNAVNHNRLFIFDGTVPTGTWTDIGGAAGETNTMSNQGAGVGVFDNKNVFDFEMRSLIAVTNEGISIALDGPNQEIDIASDYPSLPTTATDNAADFVPFLDATDSKPKKVLIDDLGFAQIDDTAGSGATAKTWSADKLVEQTLTQKASVFVTTDNFKICNFRNLDGWGSVVIDDFANSIVDIWKFDESSGNAASEINAYTAINSNITYASGKDGNAAILNGSSSDFEIANGTFDFSGLHATRNVTHAFWYKSTESGQKWVLGVQGGAGVNDSMGFESNPTGEMKLNIFDSNSVVALLISTTQVNDNVYHHIACTVDSATSTARLYIDGVEEAINTGVSSIGDPGTSLFIGAERGTAAFLGADIDEWSVWDTRLTPAAITALYNAGAGRFYSAGNKFYDLANQRLNDLSQVFSADDTGAVNAYVVTLDPAPTAYTKYMRVVFAGANQNTGASTVNVNGLGAQTITDRGGSAVISGEIVVGLNELIYDGTNFVLMSAN